MAALIEQLIDQLQSAGYRNTPARRAVLEALIDGPSHMTAPHVVAAVGETSPSVGRASIYRTLELLTRLGLVQASTLGGTETTYMLAPSGHHHHAICLECRETIEIDECVMGELEGALRERTGFEVRGHLLEIYGLCPQCAALKRDNHQS